jgi:hypothetical protein
MQGEPGKRYRSRVAEDARSRCHPRPVHRATGSCNHASTKSAGSRTTSTKLLELGRRYEALGGRNPAIHAWRSQAALALLELGEREDAHRLATEEVELARQWGARGRSARPCARPDSSREASRDWRSFAKRSKCWRTHPLCSSGLERSPSSARPYGAPTADPRHATPCDTGSSSHTAAARSRSPSAPTPSSSRPGTATPPRPLRTRGTHTERTARRGHGRRGAKKPRHRPGALRHPQDGGGSPLKRLPQAGNQFTLAASHRPRSAGRGDAKRNGVDGARDPLIALASTRCIRRAGRQGLRQSVPTAASPNRAASAD